MYAKIITTGGAWFIASHYDLGDRAPKDKGTANNTFFNQIKFLKSEGHPLVLAGNSVIAVSGPIEAAVRVNTGHNDRVRNMEEFTDCACQLLRDVLLNNVYKP